MSKLVRRSLPQVFALGLAVVAAHPARAAGQAGAIDSARSARATAAAPASRARERPAMVPCPWPTAAQDTATSDAMTPPPPAGVIDPPRPRIPDCTPPEWKRPAH
ncbi:MAG TPA: hypothetical protein VFJ20_11415, partial [Gemmatimonadaceae bacterium]|nr:hypothetical protein [Gemmatimonadaceae bacterium]